MNALKSLIDGLYQFNIETRGFDSAFDDNAADNCLIKYMRDFWFTNSECCEDYCSCTNCKMDFYMMLKEGIDNDE